MRTAVLMLALGLFVGCSGIPTEASTETSTTDSPPTSGSTASPPDDTTAGSNPTTADTGEEEVCPPMPPEDGGYDECPGLCGGGGQCFNDGAEYAVCTRGCFMDCNCWPAPSGDGDAQPRCSGALLESTSVCVLDCSGGESCPRGMFCVADLGICAHPYPGSDPDTSSSGSSSDDTTGSSTDSGTTDTGSTDSGSTDTGSTSSGSTDTGSTDSGSTDTGSTSSGSSDSGGTATTDMSGSASATGTT